MKSIKISSIIIGIICPIFLKAQHTLEYSCNIFRDGDYLDKVQIPYVEPGERGENTAWHYDNSFLDAKGYSQTYRITGDSLLCIEHETEYHYFLENDTLFLKGFENRTTRIKYEVPRIVQVFPFQYGDSISGTYSGSGIYGEKLHIRFSGTNYLVADGWGTLYNGEDSLDNVMRIHQHSEFFQSSTIDSIPDINSDSSENNLPLMIEDRFLWYRKGSRYPIMESIESTNITNGAKKLRFATSFLYLPKTQTYGLNTDLENEKKLKELSRNFSHKDIATNNGLSHLNIKAELNSDGKSLKLEYQLHENVSLSFHAYDNISRLLAATSYSNRTAGLHNETLNFTSLPIGDIILLYIKIEDKLQLLKVQIN